MRTFWYAVSMAAVSLATLVGLSGEARADCTKDNECKGDRICVKGLCVDPPNRGSCRVDTDCPGDEVCNAQRCTLSSAPPSPVAPPLAAAPPVAVAPPPAMAPLRYAPGYEEPYRGGPVPPGLKVVGRRRKGLVSAGIALLATGYGLAFVGATGVLAVRAAEDYGRGNNDCLAPFAYMYVPLLGPELLAGAYPAVSTYCSQYNAPVLAAALADAVLQWGGLGLIIGGLASKQRVLVPDTTSSVASAKPQWMVLPGVAGTPWGARLVVYDF